MSTQPVTIVPYAGYRNEDHLHLRVRVLKHRPKRAMPTTSWQKFRAMLGVYFSKEVADCRVTLDYAGHRLAVTTDKEGYAVFDMVFTEPIRLPRHSDWGTATVSTGNPMPDGPPRALVLAPGRDIHHAVISDLDDTVLETGVWNLAKNWRRVLASNPSDRVAVPGVEDLFTHIGGGAGGKPDECATAHSPSRPFFYISSSPWNLYGFLTEFLSLNRLPLGPMMLKDWGFNRKTLGKSSHGAHKTGAIERLLEFYPKLKFILIGDDSQGDVLAYAQAVANHKDRVAGVLIRHVHDESFSPEEETAIQAIRGAGISVWSGTAFDAGVDMLAELNLSTSAEVAEVVKTLDKSEIEHEAPLP